MEQKKADGGNDELLAYRIPRAKLYLLVSFFLLGLATAGCTEHAAARPDAPVIPVMAAKAEEKAMPIELHEIGTAEAYSTVSIESQVAGIVSAVDYTQGQFVKKGDLLISLDDRPFVAALEVARANLAKDRANAELAKVEAERYEQLFQSGVVPKEQFDQQTASAAAQKSAVQADEAAVKTAELNVSYCSIYAPIDGQTGSQLVYPGTVVKANDVPVLVVINRISPIYVDFSVPQQYLDQIKSYMRSEKLPVQASVSDAQPESGSLTFVNNAVDATTGTILLKGTFANRDRRLWPGEFVNVVLRLAEEKNATVVPAQAVMNGQDGDYLFVIKPDMTVEPRTVKVARTVKGESVITGGGVKPGETVVTDGQLRLTTGTKVRIKTSL